ncbi:MAG: SpoIIE family protein phosphatase, partial [Acidobacteriota bacterium]
GMVRHGVVQRRRLIRRERRRAADDRMRAEQARRLADLEEARDLQLSMLPDTVPHHPRVTLAAYMKTADVVGGDYYDFAVGDDGTITLALGDATGHGARAGLMVTATKSLFNLLARDDDLERLLRRTDESLRAMRLRRLHMALMAARLTPDAALLLLGTSLPPALHHRAASRTIDELPLDGLPLGSRHAGNRYANHHLQLAPGDVVVLLTDGLPERPAPDAQPFGYARVRDALARALIDGVTSPNALIQRLLTAADEWADGQPQTDDITLIVLRAGDD